PPAGPEVRGESRARARLPRRAGAGGAGGAPRGERVRGLLAARSRRRARRRAAGRARLLLLVRFGGRERRLLVRRERAHRGPPERARRARLSRPPARGRGLRPLSAAAGKDPRLVRDVFIIGVGQTPVGELWDRGLRELGAAAMLAVGSPDQATAGLATAADQEYVASHGLGVTALSALLMRRYMEETGQGREAFAPFAVTAHRNATANPCAMFREPITAEAF